MTQEPPITECEYCNYTGKSATDVHVHERVEHSNSNYKYEVKKCEYCGDTYYTHKSSAQQRRHCSQYCSNQNPDSNFSRRQYDNATAQYTPDWPGVRQAVLDKDNNQCVICQYDHSDRDRDLVVHHIIPSAEYNDPDDSETFDNLVTLCRPCHNSIEREPVSDQLEFFHHVLAYSAENRIRRLERKLEELREQLQDELENEVDRLREELPEE